MNVVLMLVRCVGIELVMNELLLVGSLEQGTTQIARSLEVK